MNNNVFEEQVSEYLRYNGFFLIRDFVIHFEDGQAQEMDFVGIRLPESVEQTMYSDGHFSRFVFQDDGERLSFSETPEIVLLVAEVTESKREIEKQIDRLRKPTRIRYALQRLGIIGEKDVDRLIHNNRISCIEGVRTRLLRILFVPTSRIVEKCQKENPDIAFISQGDVLSFIEERAKIDIKERARVHLPRWLHFSVNKLLHRKR